MSFFPCVAFLGGSVGTGEWIVLFVVVLIVCGPKRLPEIARKLGRMMEMFRRAADEFKDQLMNMDQDASSSSTPHESDPASDPYANPYPGNEDQVENWSPDPADTSADDAAASDGVETPPSDTSEPAADASGAPAAESETVPTEAPKREEGSAE